MIRFLAVLALLLCAWPAGAADGSPPGRSVYIVSLADVPLAKYRGGAPAKSPSGLTLKATAPEAVGAQRLDPESEASRAYLAYLDQRHADFLARAGTALARGVSAQFRYRAVANGVALELTPEEAAALSTLPEVVAVEPDRTVHVLTDAGPAFIGADQLWNGAVAGVNATQGEGVVIGVIDSGLNFSHPSFAPTGGDGFSPSNPRAHFFGQCLQAPARCNGKLIGIYDYTSEGSRDGTDADGHGSHVAGIALGNTVDASLAGALGSLRVSGTAPHASLIVYKACVHQQDSEASCSISGLLQALDQAALDGVDVINYSIGGDPRDPWLGLRNNVSDQASAMLNLRAAGVFPAVAAGNGGPQPGTVGDPALAPWVIAAANASESRHFQTTLTAITGPGVVSAPTLAGAAITGGIASRTILNAADFGFPLCGTGNGDQSLPVTGASNPWPAGTFHGEIVVCQRGVYARVAKSYNLNLAGAGGMILVNQPALGEATVADLHYVPTVHLGYNEGQQLAALMAQAAAAGGNLTGTITPVERLLDGRGDVLDGSSARGPVAPYGGWLKPNIAAPGTNIVSAAPTGAGLAVLAGTSMASPFVAGAAALVKAVHRNWSVSQVESALLTTGINDVLKQDAATSASPDEGGAGRVFVPNAVRAGLSFNISTGSFSAADPRNQAQVSAPPPGGLITAGPAALNSPYLDYNHCFERCTFTRTATDNGSGSAWRAELHLPAGAGGSVSPSTFALTPSASQALSVALDVSAPSLVGSWVYGELTLVNTSGSAPDAHLPIAVFADPGTLPDSITLNVASDHGFVQQPFAGIARLADPRFSATEIVPLRTDTRVVHTDLTTDTRFDYDTPAKTASGSGEYFKSLQLPTEQGAGAPATLTATIYATLDVGTSRAAFLFVGIDNTPNDAVTPQASDVLCESELQGVAQQHCVINATYSNASPAPSVWLAVQDLQQGSVAGDNLTLRYAVAVHDSGVAGTQKGYGQFGTLRASGPGINASGDPFDLRLAWNAPGLLPNERWVSFLSLATSPEDALSGNLPVFFNASADLSHAPVLLGSPDHVSTRLAPGTAHERIAIDVPAGATSLQVDMGGSGEADLYLAKSGGEPAPPAIGSAPPRAAAQGTSIHPGAAESVTLTAPALTPGRWYLTPVNAGGTVAEVTLNTTLSTSGNAPPTADAAYYDPSRSGHGVFLDSGGDQWVAFWYSYLEDGTPTWYLAQATAPQVGQFYWTAPLFRYTWDGTRKQGTQVGQVTLVRTGANQFNFGWLLNGSYGSEPMVRITGNGCPQINGSLQDVSGAWYAPAHSGYGYSILSFAAAELYVNYLYDGAGAPRWLLGQNSPFGSGAFALNQYSGFCPVCAFSPVQFRGAGQLQRSYTDVRDGHVAASAGFQATVPGNWAVDDTTLRITSDEPCQ